METPIIPRKFLFGNPDKSMVQISPDGETIAFLAPLGGVLNVWVAPRDAIAEARAVTQDSGRGVRFFRWAYTGSNILYIQDKNGDENWRVYSANIRTGEVKDLTPYENASAQIYMITPRRPGEILVGLNDRDPRFHDLYRIDLESGERALLVENSSFSGFLVSEENEVIGANQMREDGGTVFLKKTARGWEAWEDVPQEDALTTGFVGLDKTGKYVFLKDSRGRNTSALFIKDLATGQATLLAEDDTADVADVVIHPTERHVQAVSFIYDRKRWQALDLDFESDLERLRAVADGDLEINNRSLDDRYWIAVFVTDDSPARYYLYDRQEGAARFLFTDRKALEGYALANMYPAVIRSRDGLDLVCYYTLPYGSDSDGDGIPDRPLPLALNPHGGPWGRNNWGFNPWHQWLANRGYAALDVNFRCSTGLGKAFVNAGDKEWGGKVIEDQIDAVQWAISKGIADPAAVAVMGISFGGFSTLAGVTMFPDVFVCGVDLVGPSNLVTLIETIPPYWKPVLKQLTTRVGDPGTAEGLALLKAHSPLTYVERIRCPLLIGQGANDPRVKKAESDQIVEAMQARNIPVTYLLYPDEGHGFARPENNLSFFATAEAFLARFLKGRYEPVGDDFQGSSIQVLTGMDGAPGLAEAMAGLQPD